MTEEDIYISRRKTEALYEKNKDSDTIKARKAEVKRIQKLCKRTRPRGHVYEWYQNSSVMGGCYACVACGKRLDGLNHLDKKGVKLY